MAWGDRRSEGAGQPAPSSAGPEPLPQDHQTVLPHTQVQAIL